MSGVLHYENQNTIQSNNWYHIFESTLNELAKYGYAFQGENQSSQVEFLGKLFASIHEHTLVTQ